VLEGKSLSGAWDRSGVFLNPNSCMGSRNRPHRPLLLIAAMPDSDKPTIRSLRPCWVSAPYDDDSGRRRGERHIKADAAGLATFSIGLGICRKLLAVSS